MDIILKWICSHVHYALIHLPHLHLLIPFAHVHVSRTHVHFAFAVCCEYW